jgi:PAS domain S-box-containing protein
VFTPERQSLLLAVTAELLAGGRDEDDIAQTMFEHLRGPLGLSLLLTYRRGPGSLELVAARGLPDDARAAAATLPLDGTLCATVAASGRPVIADAPLIAADARAGLQRSLGIRAYACHPLLARDGVLLGTLGFGSTTRTGFEAGDVALLQTISQFAAISWERLRAERALAASARELADREAQFRTLAEAVPTFVFVTDPEGRNLYTNARFQRYVGRTAPEMLGFAWASLVHPEDRERTIAAWHAAVASGEPYEVRYRLRTADGSYRACLARGLPHRGGNVIARWYGTVVDVEDEERAAATLRESARQKDEFLAMLAHELRGPLAAIGLVGPWLQRALGDDLRAREPLAILGRQARQLTRLVDDLLDVSRIAQGRIELQRSAVDVTAVIEEALETVAPLVAERRHRLHARPVARAAHVCGDRARLVQCVSNLLHNAVKYTPPGGEIEVAAQVVDGEVTIAVRDTGTGIPPALLPRVFDLFVQDERTLDRSEGGLGIGLSVVKRLVELHGGSVSAHSDGPGLGSTFRIRLPTSAPDVRAVPAGPSAGAAPRRILVVDDNPDAADSMAAVLALDGHAVRTAYGSREALAILSDWTPDVVFLDLGLPGMDGHALARELRRRPALAPSRLVAVTGYGQADDREATRASGFDAHLVKPAEPADIDRLLREWSAAPAG